MSCPWPPAPKVWLSVSLLVPKGVWLLDSLSKQCSVSSVQWAVLSSSAAQLLSSSVPRPTRNQMIIHHPCGLHVSVDNGGAYKLEASFFEVLADGVGEGRRGRNVA